MYQPSFKNYSRPASAYTGRHMEKNLRMRDVKKKDKERMKYKLLRSKRIRTVHSIKLLVNEDVGDFLSTVRGKIANERHERNGQVNFYDSKTGKRSMVTPTSRYEALKTGTLNDGDEPKNELL